MKIIPSSIFCNFICICSLNPGIGGCHILIDISRDETVLKLHSLLILGLPAIWYIRYSLIFNWRFHSCNIWISQHGANLHPILWRVPLSTIIASLRWLVGIRVLLLCFTDIYVHIQIIWFHFRQSTSHLEMHPIIIMTLVGNLLIKIFLIYVLWNPTTIVHLV